MCHHGAAGVGSTLDDLWRSMACLDSLTLRARLVALPHKHPPEKNKTKAQDPRPMRPHSFALVAVGFSLLALMVSAIEEDLKNCKLMEVDFIVNEGDASLLAIEDDIVSDLAKLGITVNTRLLGKDELNEAMVAGDFNLGEKPNEDSSSSSSSASSSSAPPFRSRDTNRKKLSRSLGVRHTILRHSQRRGQLRMRRTMPHSMASQSRTQRKCLATRYSKPLFRRRRRDARKHGPRSYLPCTARPRNCHSLASVSQQ